MMISSFLYPVVIVGLPIVNIEYKISKLDYNIRYTDGQLDDTKNTMEQGFIKSQELIESNHKKYQGIIP